MRFRTLPALPCDGTGFAFTFVLADGEGIQDVRQWCTQEFGLPFGTDQAGRWFGYSIIWIRDETDALVFKIRWC